MPKLKSLRKPPEPRGPRRNDHEGTLEKLPSGLFRYKGKLNGRHVSGSACKNAKLAAKDYKAKLQELLRPPKPLQREMPILQDFAKSVLDGPYMIRVKNDTMAPSTWQMYEQMWRLNLHGSRLGRLPLDQVHKEDIELWASELRTQERITKAGKIFSSRPMASASKNRFIGAIGGILTEAVDGKEKWIIVNPVSKVSKLPREQVEFRILKSYEVEELLALCDKESLLENICERERQRRIRSNHRRRLIVLLGLHGLGPAEICGARYEDFDGEGITPARQRQRLRELGILERTRLKTEDRRAWVALDDELCALLAEEKEGYIVVTETGKPMEPANLRRTFAGMVKGTKFEGMTPYDLRHTYAMRLLEEGVDVKTAAELMRHSVEVFLRRYVRSDRDRKLEAKKKLQESRNKVKLTQH